MEETDEVLRKLNARKRRAEATSESNTMPLSELLPDRFLREHTDFVTLEEMLNASGIDVEQEGVLETPAWSQFIAERTRFKDWPAMQEAAATEWTRRKLGYSRPS